VVEKKTFCVGVPDAVVHLYVFVLVLLVETVLAFTAFSFVLPLLYDRIYTQTHTHH
jgi:hypothetical protein